MFGAATWLLSFVAATALGLAMAFQIWVNSRNPNKPPTFWDARVIQPQLIQWYVWALLAPGVMLVLDRARSLDRGWRRWTMYGGLAVITVLAQTIIAAFALGWWWAFPALLPVNPAWHIADLLRTRTVVGVLVYALIVALYHARWGAASIAAVAPLPTKPTEPAASEATAGPLALRVGDRLVFVQPDQIDWVEADGDYVIVHAGAVSHRVRQSITAMEARLPSDTLIRVSRSAMVNIAAVTEMQPWFRGNFVILLRSGARITTGARYRDRISRRL